MSSVNPLREFKISLMANRVASRFMLAMEFPTPEALKTYLKEHPGADKSLHSVKKPEKDEPKEEKPKQEKPKEDSKGTLYHEVNVPKAVTPPRKPVGKGTPPKEPKEASRVGVPGKSVPPPPKELPRLKNLTPEEELVQNAMCEIFESDPEGAANYYLENYSRKNNIFETDQAKNMLPGWNRPDLPDDPTKPLDPERADFRGRYNAVLHQAANAIVKKAFMKRLDEIKDMPEDKRKILVTSGGVAAGKGAALAARGDLASSVSATWDAAGEQNATENEWIIEECEKRGIKPTFLYVHADPIKTWRGVVKRAKGQGRMVDAQLFADSYATGAQNFKDFYDKYKDKANFVFGALDKDDNGDPLLDPELDENGKPKVDDKGNPIWKKDKKGQPAKKPARMLKEFPEESLKFTTEQIYNSASKELDEAYDKKQIGDHIYQGGSAGRRLFQ